MSCGVIRRRLALGMAVLTTSGLLAVATPTDARAATAPCAGRKVKTLTFSTGSVQIYKRRGYVCAVTLPKRPGVKRHMMVSVKMWAFRPVVDQGRYAYRAGPVTVHAGRRSVWVEGAVGRGSVDSGRWIRF
ncbi:hypothetical protein [Streptomyces sp. NL15-2K]|uniref:hypothetical protein n=1 Tax=Streptomyces sp. NL15-2K TaxID=376149 RepID=UPI000F57BEBA|nr:MULTISPECIES: hypothetical protein [Actinomycetes]WKX09327.1 hypothetical protein Q4V64_18250 [Kutzneria buriramensis]